uniref:Disks large homolog 5 N-terminal domain-containing protein n=1 Tax=Mus spicilegus TaxID=10103 RepID=A0A8C6GSX6_MUSSI
MWRHLKHTSSTASDLSEDEFQKEKERLTTELHLLIQKRNEQRDHLIAFKERSSYRRTMPVENLNPFYEQLKLQNKQVMSTVYKSLKKLIEAQENIHKLNQKISLYSNLHSRLMVEKNLTKMSITRKRESKEVHIDWALIEKYLVDLNQNGKDEQEQPGLQSEVNVTKGYARRWSLVGNVAYPMETHFMMQSFTYCIHAAMYSPTLKI